MVAKVCVNITTHTQIISSFLSKKKKTKKSYHQALLNHRIHDESYPPFDQSDLPIEQNMPTKPYRISTHSLSLGTQTYN